MISLSDAAKTQLDAYFEGKDKAPIRVFLSGGCCGPKLSLALDEVRDGDESFEAGGYTLLAEKALLAAAGAVSIDMNEYGFSVESENQLGGGGSCGSGGCGSGSGGGCGSGSGGCGC
jgi:Fe-S cluster assembly iron-binding protein IscA